MTGQKSRVCNRSMLNPSDKVEFYWPQIQVRAYLAQIQEYSNDHSRNFHSSLSIDEVRTSDAQECLEACQETEGCDYFTYYRTRGDCVMFANCVALSSNSCGDCVSGNSSCPDLICGAPGMWNAMVHMKQNGYGHEKTKMICILSFAGRCDRVYLETSFAAEVMSCLYQCQANPECEWYTFDRLLNNCIQFSTCPELDIPACDTCLSGQWQCPLPGE